MQVEQKPFTDKKPGQLVYLELGAGNGGMLLSLSEEGFRFRAVTPLRPNIQIPFAFSLDGNLRLEGNGVIEGLEDDGKSGGLRFTEVSDDFCKSLKNWLGSESAGHSGGREVTPSAATPLDTMEKIRQELRSGYSRPQSAPEPAKPVTAPPISTAPQGSQQSISLPASENQPAIPEPKPEQREVPTPRRLFSSPLPSEPQPRRPAPVSSAFLKPPMELQPVLMAPRITPPIAPPVVHPPVAPPETRGEPHERPYVPALEESFEHAWEQARRIVPPESPHLSRAAAGGIIALALVVILGALGYNFRQEIGAIVIEIGQSISGDRHAAPAPVADQTAADKSVTGNDSSQNSSDPAVPLPNSKPEKGTASSPMTPPETKQATEVRKTEPQPSNIGSPKSGTANSGLAIQPVQNPAVQPAISQSPNESAAKNYEPIESITGQDEFNVARELLRSNNRERELPKAVGLLWVGVRKGYVPAEVTLADLFRRGDGVEKNCDQARVLLVAASKKGSSDARKILEQIAEQGCE